MTTPEETNPVTLAMQDAVMCGAGIVKIWFDGVQFHTERIPIEGYYELCNELIWRADNTYRGETQ